MQRDWDVIRKLLLTLESSSGRLSADRFAEESGLDLQQVCYQIDLLLDEKAVEGRVIRDNSGDPARPYGTAMVTRMTNRGHDLLDSIRHEGVWAKTKDKFKEKGIAMTTDLVIEVAKDLMKALLLGAVAG